MANPIDPKSERWVYHKFKLPQGKKVTYSEADKLFKKGWTDAPRKFSMGLRGFIVNSIFLSGITIKKFWLDHWRWIITTSIAILALYFSLTK